MSKPSAQLILRMRHWNKDTAECTGAQIAAVMRETEHLTGDLVWFVADAEQNSGMPLPLPIEGRTPMEVGVTAVATAFVETVDQFTAGVFLAVPQQRLPVSWHEVRTEDEPYRDIGDAIIEIRAFDTSYLLLYAHDEKYLRAVAQSFDPSAETQGRRE